jgi:ATP-dependent DNA helicase RecG
MNKTELQESIGNGENSGVEFKRDDVHPDSLAKEMAALLNLEGGVEHLGMGVRNRIIESMRAHNGTEPDLIEEENRFIVRLWKAPKFA